ncbi:hypothetical protein IKF21_02025 [Candidatus Saccharibacteria bacterium]|nr:hypothetical protein [Candidatus Saccharibacteria bacterium]
MDYGNTPQNENFILDQENLNTEGGNWDNTTQENLAPERDSRAMGNKAISTPETTPLEQPATPELGQITPAMPPGYARIETPESTPAEPIPSAISFHRHNVMHGDNLSSKAIDALRDDERELEVTGDAAAFFDKIASAREQFQGKEVAA